MPKLKQIINADKCVARCSKDAGVFSVLAS